MYSIRHVVYGFNILGGGAAHRWQSIRGLAKPARPPAQMLNSAHRFILKAMWGFRQDVKVSNI